MDSEQTLRDYLAVYVPRVEEEMRDLIEGMSITRTTSENNLPEFFRAMLNYHLGFVSQDGTPTQVFSGKRIRPILTLLACAACDGNEAQAVPAAAAVELLHNFSLIHDDIEDRDEVRRGRPTLWKVWGEAQAINAGDAMFALAHQALERTVDQGVEANRVLAALRVFDDACVALTAGQFLDLSFETRTDVTSSEYMVMIEGKTGALTRAACEIGALIAGASAERVNSLGDFGAWLGIAFQVQDDVLGIWGDPVLTGKSDSDLDHRKKTMPVLYAAENDPRIHNLYFRPSLLLPPDIELLRRYIETSGAREYTEKLAQDTYAKALTALYNARLSSEAASTLQQLAGSLMQRER